MTGDIGPQGPVGMTGERGEQGPPGFNGTMVYLSVNQCVLCDAQILYIIPQQGVCMHP